MYVYEEPFLRTIQTDTQQLLTFYGKRRGVKKINVIRFTL